MKIRISDQICAYATELGFDAIAFAKAELPTSTSDDLTGFLHKDYHGDMAWMATHEARRRDPKALWPEAQSAIILGHNYGPNYDPLDKLSERETGLISSYALGDDYHDVIKKKLKLLATKIADEFGCEVKVFVDTAPLMEKPLAAQSSIGWQGKHTCIVSREFGSWLFLGEILTTLPLEADKAEDDHCGNCTRCLDICPTGAFDGPHKIDARKCISYLTIEHQGHIDAQFRSKMGNRIYGCDDCLAACPWNKFAQTARDAAYHARETLPNPPLTDLLSLDDAAFRAMFRKSPIKRIGRNRFIRNALIAAGNSGKPELSSYIKPLLTDESPLVRAMAVWSLSKLISHDEILAFLSSGMAESENDPDVLNEWKVAVSHG